MNTDSHKIFISYSSCTEDLAELIKMKLEEAHITVWKDTNQISAGEEWRNEINYGILSSDIVLVLIDNNSINSSYVTYEWAFALGSGKLIIPILIEECDIHPRMSVLQYIDFKNKKRPWDILIDLIKSNKIGQRNTIRISDLTIDELEIIITGSKELAHKNVDSDFKSDGVATVVNQLVHAKKCLNEHSETNNTILRVDDRPENNLYERKTFKAIGFEFDLAKSTEEGLSLFSKNTYAAIISDMGRVEGLKEGYVLLREIRKLNKQIPFFIYTGSNAIEHKIEAQERGAQGSTNRADELVELIAAHI